MSPPLTRSRRRRFKRGWQASTASVQVVTRGYLIGLGGGTLTLGLVAWDYQERITFGLGDSGRHGLEIGWPLTLAILAAVVTMMGTALHDARFRILTRFESRPGHNRWGRGGARRTPVGASPGRTAWQLARAWAGRERRTNHDS